MRINRRKLLSFPTGLAIILLSISAVAALITMYKVSDDTVKVKEALKIDSLSLPSTLYQGEAVNDTIRVTNYAKNNITAGIFTHITPPIGTWLEPREVNITYLLKGRNIAVSNKSMKFDAVPGKTNITLRISILSAADPGNYTVAIGVLPIT